MRSQRNENIRLATLMSIMGRDCMQTFMNLKLSEADKQKVDKCLDAGCGNSKALSVGVLVDVRLGIILSMLGSAGSQGGSKPGPGCIKRQRPGISVKVVRSVKRKLKGGCTTSCVSERQA